MTQVKIPAKQTRIQIERRQIILEGALEVFSEFGFRGSTLDQISRATGLSKPNIVYYFKSKEEIFVTLMDSLLIKWLDPLHAISIDGDPLNEVLSYVRKKLELSQRYPRESRLFANEMLQGAPHIIDELNGPLKELIDEKSQLITSWMQDGQLLHCDPNHLIISIWATTQHYADFSTQVQAVLGEPHSSDCYTVAEDYLVTLYTRLLAPK